MKSCFRGSFRLCGEAVFPFWPGTWVALFLLVKVNLLAMLVQTRVFQTAIPHVLNTAARASVQAIGFSGTGFLMRWVVAPVAVDHFNVPTHQPSR